MLTRFVRVQLTIFAIGSIVGLLIMAVVYMQAPTMLGIGRIQVTVELASTGGLYRFSNVTYRGVQIGKVTDIDLSGRGAKATLSLDNSPKISADLTAEVHSVSAIGEQYVDLRPRGDSPPYLQDGSVIPVAKTTVPQQVGPLLDQTSELLKSIPKDKLGVLLDESFKAFNGAGYDLGSLIDSSAKLVGSANDVRDHTRKLVEDSVPLLDSQTATTEDLRTWAHSLAGVTRQLADDDHQWRTIVQDGPATLNQATRLLEQIKPTLPVLLANMTSIGQVAVTYLPSLEQILVLLPPFMANLISEAPDHNPTGLGQGDFTLTLGDPPTCTVGFLPPNMWRSPEDTTEVDTPDGLYCKLPQDSPIAVRGARNYPCMGKPGKRAPTVAICDSDKPFQPLAMREHMLGPYPLDPNLIAQGVPPDDRVNRDNHLFGPAAGTPPVPPAPPGAAPAAPSGFSGTHRDVHPPIAFATYDPNSGRYVAPSGRTFRQTDLVELAKARTWKDLVMAEHS
jgi:phospholipid/cholesterol/gamma-HCH transport system substrate-binding protein